MTTEELLQQGLQHHQAGEFAAAEKIYRRVLTGQPDHPDALHLLGVIAFQSGNKRDAVQLIGRAISILPNRPEYYTNIGLALVELNRMEEGAAAYRRSLELNPNSAQTLNNLGNALVANGRADEAVGELRRALELEPSNAETAFNLGNAYEAAGRADEGIGCFSLAVSLRPDWREANNNLGHALCRRGRFDEAMMAYQGAVSRRPRCALSRFNRGIMRLRRGEFELGWPEYECRTGVTELGLISPPIDRPGWDGGDLNGKRILIYSEQGLGDTIQFARYVPLVAARGGRVTVAVQREVLSILLDIGGAELWGAIGRDALPECDVQCSLPSLPGIFRTDLGNIPSSVPYVRARGDLAAQWRKRMPEGKLKVGLCWAGRATHPEDRERSIPLERFSAIGQSGAWLVSLQKGEAASQAGAAGFAIADWSAELRDFSDTAAMIENLDLVVTVDTAVAHLAGAMGKPVWMLTQFVADWRWMLNRTDSPWYPTMRLFRQERYRDWTAPMERLARELAILRGQHPGN